MRSSVHVVRALLMTDVDLNPSLADYLAHQQQFREGQQATTDWSLFQRDGCVLTP